MSHVPQESSGQPSADQPGNGETANGRAGEAAAPAADPYSAPSAQSAAEPYPPPSHGQPPPQPYDQNTGQPGYGQAGYGQPGYPPAGSYGQPQQPYGPGGQPGSGYDPNQQYQQYNPGPQQGYDPNQQYPQQYSQGGQPGYPQPQYPGQPPVPGQQPVSPSDEKLWSTLAHISIPFIGFVGPLIAYLVFKDRSQWIKDNSVEALNFSILYSIAQVVSIILTAVIIGSFLLPLIGIAALVLCILAAIEANKGEFYRYPVNWRIIKG